MHRFFIYEEYGAKYKLMIKDVASAHRTMPGWLSYQKGLELLAASLVPDGQGDHSRKSLTIGDLLVKVNALLPCMKTQADMDSRSNECANIPCSSGNY
jgi:hypothetical protein